LFPELFADYIVITVRTSVVLIWQIQFSTKYFVVTTTTLMCFDLGCPKSCFLQDLSQHCYLSEPIYQPGDDRLFNFFATVLSFGGYGGGGGGGGSIHTSKNSNTRKMSQLIRT
jgi:hypothetical protein